MSEKKDFTPKEKLDRIVSAMVTLNEAGELTSSLAEAFADRAYELGQEEGKTA